MLSDKSPENNDIPHPPPRHNNSPPPVIIDIPPIITDTIPGGVIIRAGGFIIRGWGVHDYREGCIRAVHLRGYSVTGLG